MTSADNVRLGEANAADTESIRQVHRDAFGEEGPAMANLAIALLNDETAKPLFCLVAEEEDRVVGSIIFSRAGIEGHDDLAVYILAPLAVDPGFQHRGVGRALIEHGLDRLRRQGASLVFVVGDPAYYARVGFTHHHHIDPRTNSMFRKPGWRWACAIGPSSRSAVALHAPVRWTRASIGENIRPTVTDFDDRQPKWFIEVELHGHSVASVTAASMD